MKNGPNIPADPALPILSELPTISPAAETSDAESSVNDQHARTRISLFPSAPPSEMTRMREWFGTLAPEELEIVRQLGFKFHFVKGILEEPELIALPGEEAKGEQLSFHEIIDLLREIVEDARELLAEENKQQDPLVKELRPFNSYLRSLAETNWGLPNQTIDIHFVTAVKRIPLELLRCVIANIKPEEKIKIRGHVKQQLRLSDDEETTLYEVISQIVKILENMRRGQHVSQEDVQSILTALNTIERFHEALQIVPSKKKGFDEIDRLLAFIPSWIEILELVREQGALYKRSYLNLHAKALGNIFPEEITPLVTLHHRDVREQRLQNYEKLADIIEQIDDYRLKKTVRRIILQMSSTLTYVDAMWEMHEITIDQHNKQIIYPKRMLTIAPLVCREVKILLNGLKKATSLLTEKKEKEDDDEDIIDIDFSTHEIDKREESQPGFRVPATPIEGTIGATSEQVIQLIEQLINPTRGQKNIDQLAEKTAECFESLQWLLSDSLKKAQHALSQTKVQKTDVHPDRSGHITVHHGETLSFHIQDFITILNSGLIQALAHIANTFNKSGARLLRRDIIPEYRMYEDQTANLRRSIEQLKQGSRRAKELLESVRIERPEHQNAAPLLMGAKEAIRQVAESIRHFEQRRNDEIAARNYYGILKGGDYDAIHLFTETVRSFFLDRECDIISSRSVATHSLLKDIEQLAMKVTNTPFEETSANTNIRKWLKIHRGLSKLARDVHQAQNNGGIKGELMQKFRTEWLELIHAMIELGAENHDDPRQKVFAEFVTHHPFALDVKPEDFSTEFFAFRKVVNQFEDFHTALGNNMVDETLLTEYDHRVAGEMTKHLFIIAKELQSERSNAHQSDEIISAREQCALLNTDLEFSDPELARMVHWTLSYISHFPDYVDAYHQQVRQHDFRIVTETIQYLCDELNRRFRIPD